MRAFIFFLRSAMICSAVLIPSVPSTSSAQVCDIPLPGQILCDDFSDGDLRDDKPVSWNRYLSNPAGASAESGDLIMQTVGISLVTADAVEMSDVSVRTRVRPGEGFGAMGVIVRHGDDRCDYRGLISFLSDGVVGDLCEENWESQKLIHDPTEQDTMLQLDAFGQTVKFWAWPADQHRPLSPLITHRNVGPVNGAIRLIFGSLDADNEPVNNTAVYRYVQVANEPIVQYEPGEHIPFYREVGGRREIGTDYSSPAVSDLEYGPSQGRQPGLLQRWYSISNPGSLDEVYSQVFDPFFPEDAAEPDADAFHSSYTWWTGNRQATERIPSYPFEMLDRPRKQDGGTWNSANNQDYTVYLTGELLIPESGTYRFVDGVDDFVAFGIDLNQDGVIDNGDEEFLINDNSWTDLNREANDGGLPSDEIPNATFTNIPEGGAWYSIEAIFAERGGGDSGVIYWDFDAQDHDHDGVRVGDAKGFPTAPNGEGRTIADEDIAHLLIPETHLRSNGGASLKGGEAVTRLAESTLNFELGADGHVDQLSVDRVHEFLTTRMFLEGATIQLSMLHGIDPSELRPGEYPLLIADELIGEAKLSVSAELVGLVDTSRLFAEGILIVANPWDCDLDGAITVLDANCTLPDDLARVLQFANLLPGDANGDGNVDFSDFLKLSAGFGQAGQYTDGDFNKDGTIEFSDFLLLSSNFGRSFVDSASVPEPEARWMCIAAIALVGKRRNSTMRRLGRGSATDV